MSNKWFIALLPLSLMLGAAETPEANLIKCGDFESPDAAKAWNNGWWVWQRGSRDKAHRDAIGKMTQRSIQKGVGKDNSAGIRIFSSLDIKKERNDKGQPDVASSYSQVVGVPDSNTPVKYLFSFDAKGQTFKAPGMNSMRIFAEFYDTPPEKYGWKKTREGINQGLEVPVNWETKSFSFIAPPHTRKIKISFSLYGLGDVCIDNVKLQNAANVKNAGKPVDLK